MVATSVPVRLFGKDVHGVQSDVFDGSGTWEMVEEEGRHVVRLRFHLVAGRTVDWGTRLYLSRTPQLVLWFDFDDPDAGRQFGFVKFDQ